MGWLAVAGILATMVWGPWRSTAPAADGRAPESPSAALQKALLHRNLDQPGDPGLAAMYAAINLDHFSGVLPDVPIRWEPDLVRVGEHAAPPFSLEGMFGYEGGRSMILLTPALAEDARALERVLCHEMVHVYLHRVGKSSTGHGPEFQTVLHRLSVEGAFEGLVATHDERVQLRAWLDHESRRLDAETAALEAIDLELTRERPGVEYDPGRLEAFNTRVAAANARLEQLRRDREAYLRAVDRYNLMLVYPDGLAEEAVTAAAPGPPASAGN